MSLERWSERWHGRTACERCGSVDGVRRRLCRRCRDELRGKGTPLAGTDQPSPSRIPHGRLRNPPWRRRGA